MKSWVKSATSKWGSCLSSLLTGLWILVRDNHLSIRGISHRRISDWSSQEHAGNKRWVTTLLFYISKCHRSLNNPLQIKWWQLRKKERAGFTNCKLWHFLGQHGLHGIKHSSIVAWKFKWVRQSCGYDGDEKSSCLTCCWFATLSTLLYIRLVIIITIKAIGLKLTHCCIQNDDFIKQYTGLPFCFRGIPT